jgi:hypothetical protein
MSVRLRLTAVTAVVVALAVALAACGSGGGKRSRGGSSSSSGGYYHDDDDDDYDYDGSTGYDDSYDDPAPTPTGDPALERILPDRYAMYGTGFLNTLHGPESATDAGTWACADSPALCEALSSHAHVEFGDADGDRAVWFEVLDYGGATAARAALDGTRADYAGDPSLRSSGLDTPDEADLSYVVKGDYQTLVLQGPYVGVVDSSSMDEFTRRDGRLHEGLAEMFNTRMAQAAAGREPSAEFDGPDLVD